MLNVKKCHEMSRVMKCQMLETNIPKSICSKLQIWVSQYFLVRLRTLVPKYICSKLQKNTLVKLLNTKCDESNL